MCLAIPGKVVRWIDTDPLLAVAEVEFGGVVRPCHMACVSEARVGDYVVVHAGVAIARLDAQEALRIGLVIHVIPAAKMQEEAFKLAKRIARVPRHAVMLNKLQIDVAMDDMGYLNATRHAHLVDAMCHFLSPQTITHLGANLKEIQRAEGFRAFLQAREAPFSEDERPFRKK